MEYKSYKFKVQYKTFCSGQKEVKFESHNELEQFLGETILILESAIVYQKIKGTWEIIRVIESKINYGL